MRRLSGPSRWVRKDAHGGRFSSPIGFGDAGDFQLIGHTVDALTDGKLRLNRVSVNEGGQFAELGSRFFITAGEQQGFDALQLGLDDS